MNLSSSCSEPTRSPATWHDDPVRDLRLQPLDERWALDVAELVTDPQVQRFTRIPEPPPEDFARRWIATYKSGRRDGTSEGFAVLDGEDRLVGLGLAPQINRIAGELELGYVVAPVLRGRGAATRTLTLLTEWAFRDVHAQRAYLVIDTDNLASQRVARRCGYQQEGVMRSIHLKPGRRVDAGLWSRLPSDP